VVLNPIALMGQTRYAPMLFADAIIKNGAKKCLTMEI
jgi:hypothetical protein